MSVPFLLATFLVYALIPELRNLHGMCLMAYCGGLIVAYPFLAYLKLHVGRIGVAMTGCLVIGENLLTINENDCILVRFESDQTQDVITFQ